MRKFSVFISPSGEISCIYHDVADRLSGQKLIKRVSHVEPSHRVWRWFFYVIRSVVVDDSAIAEWTRRWPCQWRINMTPMGGKVLPELYYFRSEAIEREIAMVVSLMRQGGISGSQQVEFPAESGKH